MGIPWAFHGGLDRGFGGKIRMFRNFAEEKQVDRVICEKNNRLL
jgi:hypothetical protein